MLALQKSKKAGHFHKIINGSIAKKHLYGEPGEGEHDGDDGDQLDHPPLVPQSVLANTGSTSLEMIWFHQLYVLRSTQITEKYSRRMKFNYQYLIIVAHT